ncbi:MAG TPA: 2-oxoglutarate dehydrogenase, E2 component, dihydrolipoamide succinyltransferase [Gaiellaceae bacterium]|jgi:2-oxoglutarate dehydrogenase E2 component (dihydrolipoamide succinyltransferase)|nr:2-oxoglutarate dehydrogenase, E2 component, dihydrolipoamide succinyltransferase [Gaiellaceae bacterium]
MATETAVDVVMPQMGVSVSEGTVTKWLKQEGDTVEADEALLEISTDKVDTEVPSPAAGVVTQIFVQEGETVEVGTKLAQIGGSAGAAQPAAEAPPEPATQAAADASMAAASEGVGDIAPSSAGARSEVPQVEQPTENGKAFVSPVVARIASEHGVDPNQVSGTGRGGRVTKKDILDFIESGAPAAAAPAAPAPAAPAGAAPQAKPAPAPAAPAEAQPGESLEPVTAMRRGIAEHMRRSLDTGAHVTSAIEVDMSRVVAAREQLKKEYQASYGVNPTYLAFIARATVQTLRDYPYVNAELRGDSIVTRNFVNLGIAVELAEGKGLIVPVLRNAETMNLLGLAKGIADIAAKARDKKLMPDDVQGGTFTITNPGGYGTFHGTPVISQPQSGILGTYALVKRPWVVQDSLGKDVIAIRPLMNITLTYDHRLVDGAYAGRFLRDLRERLESWEDDGG